MVVNFNDQQCSQIFNVEIFEDAVPEDVEELNVTLILDPTLMGIVSEQVIVDPAVLKFNLGKYFCDVGKFGCNVYLYAIS